MMAAFVRFIKPFMKRGEGLRVRRAPRSNNKAWDGRLNNLMTFNNKPPSPQSFLSPSLRLFTSSINGTVAIPSDEQAWNTITDSLKPGLKQMIIDNDKEAFKRVTDQHVKDDAFDADLAFAYGRRAYGRRTVVDNTSWTWWHYLFMLFAGGAVGAVGTMYGKRNRSRDDDWKNKLNVWYSDERKFNSMSELVYDLENAGNVTLCPGIGINKRVELFFHIFSKAEGLHRNHSDYSNIIEGVAGIGKTTLIKEMASRIPSLFNDVCCLYLPCNVLKGEFPRIEDLINYIKPKCKKDKYLVFLDDADSVFYRDDNSAQLMVGGVANVIPPDISNKNINVQILSSSQILSRLFQRKITPKFADSIGLCGYKTPKINQGKLPVFIPTCPDSKDELMKLGQHIAFENDGIFNDEAYHICSWYFGGIARSIERFIKGENYLNIAAHIWSKFDDNSRMFYMKCFELNKLGETIKTINDIHEYMFNNDAFSIQGQSFEITDVNLEDLLHSGFVYETPNGIKPTFPFVMLYGGIIKERVLTHQLFLSTLIDVELTKSEAKSEYESAKLNGSTVEEIQRLYIKTRQFSDKTELPNLLQLSLRLNDILSEKGDSLYNGVISIDLLNFGAVNKNLSMDIADDMLGEFGKKYREIALKYKDKMKLCAPYHRSGDEFVFVCTFKEEQSFQNLTKEIASVVVEKKYEDGNVVKTIPCYGRCGAVYAKCDKTPLFDGFTKAKMVENSIKNDIARHLGYNNAVEMKDLTKSGEHDIRPIKNLDVLWKYNLIS